MTALALSSPTSTLLHRVPQVAVLALLQGAAWVGVCAHAQTPSPTTAVSNSDSAFALGLGVTSRQLPYAGIDRDNLVVPVVSYQNRWIKLAGATAELRLVEFSPSSTQTVSAGMRVKYDNWSYKPSDSPFLAGMDKRKSSLWGGPAVEWKTPFANVSAEWTADLMGNSKGQKFQMQIDRQFRWGRVGLTPRLQAQWLDAKYVDYYFGVQDHEVRVGRPAYQGAAAMLVEAGLRADYALGNRHVLFMDLSTSTLPQEIKNSPIVDRSSMSRVTLGYLYRF